MSSTSVRVWKDAVRALESLSQIAAGHSRTNVMDEKSKKTSASPPLVAIRINRPHEQDLPIELRDFAVLLAEIAAQQLRDSKQSNEEGFK